MERTRIPSRHYMLVRIRAINVSLNSNRLGCEPSNAEPRSIIGGRNDAYERVLHARNAENALTSDTVQPFLCDGGSLSLLFSPVSLVLEGARRTFTTICCPVTSSGSGPTGPASNISRRKVRSKSLPAIPGNPWIRGNDFTPRACYVPFLRDIRFAPVQLPEDRRRVAGTLVIHGEK